VIGIRIHIPELRSENRTDPTRKKARFAANKARQKKESLGENEERQALMKLTM
jgi:hypothetical protein